MTKSSIWKILFILFIVLISFSLITPFEDHELGEYALSQANSKADATAHPQHVEFSEVMAGVRFDLSEGQAVDFKALRDYGQKHGLDYAAYFQPPKGVFGTVTSRLFPFWIKPGIRAGHEKDRDRRNDLVLRTLLKNSQMAIKKGLDLRGGIAFTMEANDLNRVTVLRRVLHPMSTIDAMEFMLSRITKTASNSDFNRS